MRILSFCSSFSVHVVIKQLCRYYQMMRKGLYMIALVRQVYKENMEIRTMVQWGYDHYLASCFLLYHFGNPPVLKYLLFAGKLFRWIHLKFLRHFSEDQTGFLEVKVKREASISI